MEYTRNYEYTRFAQALYGIKQLRNHTIETLESTIRSMIFTAGTRIQGLKDQAKNASVNVDHCLIDLSNKMINATKPYFEEVKDKADTNVQQCSNEAVIITSVINNVNKKVVGFQTSLKECNDDENCLKDLLQTVVNNIDLPYTITLTVEKSLKNINFSSKDIVQSLGSSISEAQYKLDRVIGLLDKCVHETIHH